MASVHVALPTLLADHTGGVDRIALNGDTVEAVLRALGQAHPRLDALLWRDGLWRDREKLNPILAVFVNQDNIEQLAQLATPLADGDTVTVISALEGG